MVAVEQENRPRLDLIVNGQTVNFLYDTGAIRTCVTTATYQKYFSQSPLHRSPSALTAAGNVNLDAQGQFMATIQHQDKHLEQPIEVCGRVSDNLMGIELINGLELSYRASTNSLFAITKDGQWAITKHEVFFKPQSVTIVSLKTTKPGDNKEEDRIAYTSHGAFPTLTGGPALIHTKQDGSCFMAITTRFDVLEGLPWSS